MVVMEIKYSEIKIREIHIFILFPLFLNLRKHVHHQVKLFKSKYRK